MFAGHKHNQGGNIVKRRNSESINASSAPRKTKKAHPSYTSGTNTGVATAQPTSGPDHAKTAARGASPGAAAPRVLPHPHHRLSGPALSDGCMAACKGGLRRFPILPAPKPTIKQYKCRVGALSQHTPHLEPLPHYHILVLFYFLVVFCEQGKAIKESLAPWKKGSLV